MRRWNNFSLFGRGDKGGKISESERERGAASHCEVPLAMAQQGKPLKVCHILGGRSVCARLAHLGIYPGVEIELLCGGCHAPCLVKVHNATISLGSGISQKIVVVER